jgi:hypothetical protein
LKITGMYVTNNKMVDESLTHNEIMDRNKESILTHIIFL